MSLLKLQQFLLVCVLYQVYLTTAKDVSTKRVVCYFDSYNRNRVGKGIFHTSTDIPFPNLCTHIIYAFAKLSDNILTYDTPEEYENILKLKKCNKDLKVLLAVGGYWYGSDEFIKTTSSRKNIKEFAHNARNYLEKFGFDGLDFIWYYPGEAYNRKFTELLQITRKVFRKSKKYLLITAPLDEVEWKNNATYELKKIAKVLDFINLNSYDFHNSYDSKLFHDSPLYPSKQSGSDPKLNVYYLANLFTAKGVPKEKLVIGIPTYAKTQKISDSNKTNPEDPAIPGTNYTGPYTNEEGILAYYEVCELLPNATKQVWDEDMQVPYAVIDNQFTSYDDERSVENKADFIIKNGYGGASIWSLDFDDFSGEFCGKGKYPIITAIDAKIRGGKRTDYLATCDEKATSVPDKDITSSCSV